MENSINNPLTKFFRQPAIYLALPSGGSHWPEGSLDLPLNNEIPVYPMTTKDEIILRTPDALLNGSGVVEVIQSCCPNILDAWKTPSVDVDAILIAIRIASYGANMDSESLCPHCGEANNHEVELSPLLGTIKCPSYKKITVNDLQIKIKPQLFFGVNRENAIEFEEQKLRQALEKSDLEADVRGAEITKSIERLIDIGNETLVDSTEYIETPDGTIVSNREHIKSFYENAGRTVVGVLQEKLKELNQQGGVDPINLVCGSCSTEYQIPLLFDYSSFFGIGS